MELNPDPRKSKENTLPICHWNLNSITAHNFSLVRTDHPDNIKRGGVCIYHKESLPFRIKTLPYFKEALLVEMIHNNKKVLVSVIYRSPSQSNCEFEAK